MVQAVWRPIFAPEGVRPPLTFTDGAGGFLPGVPWAAWAGGPTQAAAVLFLIGL